MRKLEAHITPATGNAMMVPNADPDLMTLVSLVRSSGGAQHAIMAYIAGNVTPYGRYGMETKCFYDDILYKF